MTIDELIEELQKAKTRIGHGHAEVLANRPVRGGDGDIKKVTVQQSGGGPRWVLIE